MLLSQALAGPSHAALVGLGVLLHVACSLLVWRIARGLGLDASAAWVASGLHLTAYPGFHAYLWPIGVQHVVTVLGVLALMDLYLATDRRARDGRPSRGLFWATVAVALLASLSRATSAVGPAAILAHAALGPGDPRRRLERYDRWRVPMFLALVYPLALTAYGNDVESLSGVPPAAEAIRLLVWRVSPAAAFGCLLAVTFGVLLVVRALLGRAGDSSASPRRRLARRLGGAIAALALAPKLAVVTIWGVGFLLAPLGSALLSHNTHRWHVASAPLDLVAVIASGLVVAFFAGVQRGNRDLLVLLAPAALFALALHATEPQPIRYWIYLTPVLAIVLAGAASAAAAAVAATFYRSTWWAALALAVAAGVVMVANVTAIRLQLWRHTLADSFLVLDYVRAADLISHDLAALGAGRNVRICVDGLTRMPHEEGWATIFAPSVPLGALNARIILARGLGRSPDTVNVGCPAGSADPGMHRYRVDGTAIERDGRPIDAFARVDAELRELVAAGDYARAGAIVGAMPGARPFTIRHLLGELPDADAAWLTNGASILVWLGRTSDNHDHWYARADDKVAKLRALAAGEITAYARFQILADYVRRRNAPAGEPPRMGPLPFGGIPFVDVKALLDADPVLKDLPNLAIGLKGLERPEEDTRPPVPGVPGSVSTGQRPTRLRSLAGIPDGRTWRPHRRHRAAHGDAVRRDVTSPFRSSWYRAQPRRFRSSQRCR